MEQLKEENEKLNDIKFDLESKKQIRNFIGKQEILENKLYKSNGDNEQLEKEFNHFK